MLWYKPPFISKPIIHIKRLNSVTNINSFNCRNTSFSFGANFAISINILKNRQNRSNSEKMRFKYKNLCTQYHQHIRKQQGIFCDWSFGFHKDLDFTFNENKKTKTNTINSKPKLIFSFCFFNQFLSVISKSLNKL